MVLRPTWLALCLAHMTWTTLYWVTFHWRHGCHGKLRPKQEVSGECGKLLVVLLAQSTFSRFPGSPQPTIPRTMASVTMSNRCHSLFHACFTIQSLKLSKWTLLGALVGGHSGTAYYIIQLMSYVWVPHLSFLHPSCHTQSFPYFLPINPMSSFLDVLQEGC